MLRICNQALSGRFANGYFVLWNGLRDLLRRKRIVYTILNNIVLRISSQENHWLSKKWRSTLLCQSLFLCAAGVALLLLISPLHSAYANQELSSIYGQVTDVNGNPLANITVILEFSCCSGQQQGGALTDENGEYVMLGPYNGEYVVHFYDRSEPNEYQPESYSNAYDEFPVTSIVVLLGQTITGIDAQMEGYGSVAGRVTDANGQPVTDMSVLLMALFGINPEDAIWEAIGFADTDQNGDYVIERLLRGKYRIGFSQAAFPQKYHPGYYGGTYLISTGQDIAVGRGEDVVGLNYTPSSMGQISGQITNAQGEGITEVQVTASLNGSVVEDPLGWFPPETATTDSNGNYTIADVFTGSYRISFGHAVAPSLYQFEYYDNVYNEEDAASVAVAFGESIRLDATLLRLGTISGTVTNLDGMPVQATVHLCNTEGACLQSVRTNEDGMYTVLGVPLGSYKIDFTSDNTMYASQSYTDSASDENPTLIEIQGGEIFTDIDGQLPKWSVISGKVLDVDGKPISDTYIYAHRSEECCTDFTFVNRSALTTEDGLYEIHVAPGKYILRTVYNDVPKLYRNEFYGGSFSQDEAVPVTVGLEATMSMTDFQLDETHILSGTITDQAGNPVSGMRVDYYYINPDSCCTDWIIGHFAADTDIEGNFELRGLDLGRYRIRVADLSALPQYVPTFYGNTRNIEAATDVLVGDEQPVSGIDIIISSLDAIYLPFAGL